MLKSQGHAKRKKMLTRGGGRTDRRGEGYRGAGEDNKGFGYKKEKKSTPFGRVKKPKKASKRRTG